ncbi:hypothetical protein K438DRAFT_1937973 [Mycena galopus ATCC 62051]|nr:hypothetical protein K438DRAFT_1937973 [Mycena galopus ATCC 62051]
MPRSESPASDIADRMIEIDKALIRYRFDFPTFSKQEKVKIRDHAFWDTLNTPPGRQLQKLGLRFNNREFNWSDDDIVTVLKAGLPSIRLACSELAISGEGKIPKDVAYFLSALVDAINSGSVLDSIDEEWRYLDAPVRATSFSFAMDQKPHPSSVFPSEDDLNNAASLKRKPRPSGKPVPAKGKPSARPSGPTAPADSKPKPKPKPPAKTPDVIEDSTSEDDVRPPKRRRSPPADPKPSGSSRPHRKVTNKEKVYEFSSDEEPQTKKRKVIKNDPNDFAEAVGPKVIATIDKMRHQSGAQFRLLEGTEFGPLGKFAITLSHPPDNARLSVKSHLGTVSTAKTILYDVASYPDLEPIPLEPNTTLSSAKAVLPVHVCFPCQLMRLKCMPHRVGAPCQNCFVKKVPFLCDHGFVATQYRRMVDDVKNLASLTEPSTPLDHDRLSFLADRVQAARDLYLNLRRELCEAFESYFESLRNNMTVLGLEGFEAKFKTRDDRTALEFWNDMIDAYAHFRDPANQEVPFVPRTRDALGESDGDDGDNSNDDQDGPGGNAPAPRKGGSEAPSD